ncbi:MAG TPA: CNNM domain-containing protein, partial [Kutzneria sp.]|nr:CNNM domain-containing protein [Kutzneria sp.]
MTGYLFDVLCLLAVLLLTAANAVFVTAEFSLTTLERSQVDTAVAQVGDARSRTVQKAHRTLSFQLSGAQLGITLATLVTGALAEPALADLIEVPLTAIGMPAGGAEAVGAALALLLASALSVVLGELVPKNLAIARPMQVARAVAGFQYAFSRACKAPITVLNGSANWIVRRFGVEPAEE